MSTVAKSWRSLLDNITIKTLVPDDDNVIPMRTVSQIEKDILAANRAVTEWQIYCEALDVEEEKVRKEIAAEREKIKEEGFKLLAVQRAAHEEWVKRTRELGIKAEVLEK